MISKFLLSSIFLVALSSMALADENSCYRLTMRTAAPADPSFACLNYESTTEPWLVTSVSMLRPDRSVIEEIEVHGILQRVVYGRTEAMRYYDLEAKSSLFLIMVSQSEFVKTPFSLSLHTFEGSFNQNPITSPPRPAPPRQCRAHCH